MRMKLICAAAGFGVLAGCGGGPMPAEDLAATNPIAVYCIEQGGDYRIVPEVDGSADSICVLPDGTEQNAADFYRQNAAGSGG